MVGLYFKKAGKVRRILSDGKIQEWSPDIGCWKGMKRRGKQWESPEATAAGWEASGWKRIGEDEAEMAKGGSQKKLPLK